MVKILMLALMVFACVFQGCKSNTSILVLSSTVLGLDADVNYATQVPHFKGGIVRTVLISVPTDRNNDATAEKMAAAGTGPDGRADNSTPVAVDFSTQNIFSIGSLFGWASPSEMSDRVLIGSDALRYQQLMMLKDWNGRIDPAVAAATKAVNSLPDVVVPPAPSKIDSDKK